MRNRTLGTPSRIEEQRRVATLAPVQRMVHMAREHEAWRVVADGGDQIRISGICPVGPRGDERLARRSMHDPGVGVAALRPRGRADVEQRQPVHRDALPVGPDVRIRDVAQPIRRRPTLGIGIPFEIVIPAAHGNRARKIVEPVGDPRDLPSLRSSNRKVEHVARHHDEIMRGRAMEQPVEPALVEMKIGDVKYGHGSCPGCARWPRAIRGRPQGGFRNVTARVRGGGWSSRARYRTRRGKAVGSSLPGAALKV